MHPDHRTRQGASIYHILLVGIDTYPPEFQSLLGCVNDIDAVEKLLFDKESGASMEGELRVTRLAAPHTDAPSLSRFQDQTLLPTRANIVKALQGMRLAARLGERALIYYSGHGHYLRWTQGSAWHEALVPCDMQFLYDIEVNTLINSIAYALGGDLTVVLDCCHSAGAFRDLTYNMDNERKNASNIRFLTSSNPNAAPILWGPAPDPTLVRPQDVDRLRRNSGNSMLRASDPNYILIAACQAVEAARERPMRDGRYYGLLTYALLETVRRMPSPRRMQLRWVDIWPHILERVEQLGRIAPRTPQHPCLVGRPERRVFGGTWRRQDAGIPVYSMGGGEYEVGAGSLVGLTPGSQLALYGAETDRFPPLDTVEDLESRLGLLLVVEGGLSRSKAKALIEPVSANTEYTSYRGRMVSQGVTERHRVHLDVPDADVACELEGSPILQVIMPTAGAPGDVEVLVGGTKDSGWIIKDEITPDLAQVPPGEVEALRAGLIHYARFNAVLRMARQMGALSYLNPLDIALLDCADGEDLSRMVDSHDPNLADLPRVSPGAYILPTNTHFCIRVHNNYDQVLYVSVFNCEAFGRVDYMGHLTIRAHDRQVLWDSDEVLNPWILNPSRKREAEERDSSTDRLVFVATTRPGVSFSYLAIEQSVQEVVDSASFRGLTGEVFPGPSVPNELWVAQMIIVKIVPKA